MDEDEARRVASVTKAIVGVGSHSIGNERCGAFVNLDTGEEARLATAITAPGETVMCQGCGWLWKRVNRSDMPWHVWERLA